MNRDEKSALTARTRIARYEKGFELNNHFVKVLKVPKLKKIKIIGLNTYQGTFPEGFNGLVKFTSTDNTHIRDLMIDVYEPTEALVRYLLEHLEEKGIL